MHFAEWAVTAAIVLFGLVVPALVLLGDQAAAGPGGTQLSAELKEGRRPSRIAARRVTRSRTPAPSVASGRTSTSSRRPKA